MIASFFVKVVVLQGVVALLIIWILKRVLDKMLIGAALKEFRIYQQGHLAPVDRSLRITSHKNLSKSVKLQILKVAIEYGGEGIRPVFEVDKKILGGLMIAAGPNSIDCSLRDRLRKAFPGLRI